MNIYSLDAFLNIGVSRKEEKLYTVEIFDTKFGAIIKNFQPPKPPIDDDATATDND